MILLGSLILGIGGWSSPIPIQGNFAALLPFWISCFVAAWYLSKQNGLNVFRALRSNTRWFDAPVGLAIGVGAQLLMPIIYLPILKLFNTDAETLEKPARELVDTADGRFPTFLLILMTVLFAPFAEEVLYRGVLLRGLEGLGVVKAVVFSSLVFGVIHLQPLQFFGLSLFGALAAALVVTTNRLPPAIFAHIAFNGVSVFLLLS